MEARGGCLVVFVRDITQRKCAEQLLKQSQERLSVANRAGVIGVWDWDITSNSIVWDEVMYRLYGMRAEDFDGAYQAWVSAIHPEDRVQTETAIQAALRGEREYDPEFRVVWPDGSIRYIKSASRTQFDEHGKAVRMTGINYDLTEQKRAEQALSSAKLEAENANRAKSEFVSNMSHEIRTPMNAIIGLSSLALRQDLSPKLHDYVSKIHSSSLALLYLINDILDFSKVESGCLELDVHEFKLNEVIRNIFDLFFVRIEEKSLKFLLDIPLNVPLNLLGDDLRPSQVLSNLVANAVKFTDAGEVGIKVCQLSAELGYTTLRFCVFDSGIGISSEQLTHLFQPFMQADNSITRRYGGTGLGLTICKRLVAMMGGEITVESVPGKGSTFCFTLRFAVSAANQPDCQSVTAATLFKDVSAVQEEHGKDAPAHPATHEMVAAVRGARILLVEDNVINQQVAQGMLEHLGFEFDVAPNGQQALEHLQRDSYNAVLMDLQMPVMDGLTAAREIRSNPRFADLPIIAMTAAAMAKDKDASLAAGMNDHITKPIIIRELRLVLDKWVKVGQQFDDTNHTESPPSELPVFSLDHFLEMNSISPASAVNLLRQFSKMYLNAAEEVKLLVNAGKYEEAGQFLHSLRGAASMLGAKELSLAASVLEEEILQENSVDGMELFELKLAQTLDTIARLPDGSHNSG
ncbi:MAG: ATP-binding protein [Gallionella sp.]|nr:ATP-binding protein [Gallionella sp.]MDD4960137.1 ATP-binding protein [Gallionella sp.]